MSNGKPIPFVKSTKQYVQSIPLDHFNFESDKIGLIKIDVEGFELKVIRGGWKTISKDKPVLIIEQNSIHLSSELPNSAILFLTTHGYKISEIHSVNGVPTDYILTPIAN